jgi:hypothetical protein
MLPCDFRLMVSPEEAAASAVLRVVVVAMELVVRGPQRQPDLAASVVVAAARVAAAMVAMAASAVVAVAAPAALAVAAAMAS